jgi:hypothetical protein
VDGFSGGVDGLSAVLVTAGSDGWFWVPSSARAMPKVSNMAVAVQTKLDTFVILFPRVFMKGLACHFAWQAFAQVI